MSDPESPFSTIDPQYRNDGAPAISDRANELQQQLVRQDTQPPPELVIAVKRFYVQQREELLRQVAEIEAFIGFVETSDNLAVRIAKIEAFLGVKA